MSLPEAYVKALKRVSGPLEFRIDPTPFSGTKFERFVYTRSDPIDHECIVQHLVDNTTEIQNPLTKAIYERHKRAADSLTATDTAFVSQYLNSCSTDLNGLATEMQTLRSQVDALCSQYVALACRVVERANEMDLVCSLVAPIRKLPPEILTIIFRLSLPSGRNRSRLLKDGAFRLSRVCSVWRDVVRQDPGFWCHHSITIPDALTICPSSLSDRRDSLTTLQARSGSRPMTLVIRDQTENFNQPPQLTEIMDFLVSSFSKYSHLEFKTLSPLWYDYLDGLGDKLASNVLKDVTSISICMRHKAEDVKCSLRAFRNAPRLQKVTFDVADAKGALYVMLPPRKLLTLGLRVHLDQADYLVLSDAIFHYQGMLGRYYALKEASIELLSPSSHLLLGEMPIVPPDNTHSLELTSLSVVNACSGDASQLLRAFNLPSLRHFKFEATTYCDFVTDGEASLMEMDTFGDTPDTWMVFDYALVINTFKGLTSLTLLRVSMEKEDYRTLFTTTSLVSLRLFLVNPCPSLMEFQVHETASDSDFLQLFDQSPTDNDIRANRFVLPFLKDLHLYHPCHVGTAKLLKRTKKYTKLIKSRANLLATQARLTSANPATHTNVEAVPEFKFTLSFSKEHNMLADIPLVMEELEKTVESLLRTCEVDIGYEVEESFQWKLENVQ